MSQAFNPQFRATFDEDWYYKQYYATIDKFRLPDETVFDFYFRAGARLGHDPHELFSELLYRIHNRDVYDSILKHKNHCGYMHFLDIGHTEVLRVSQSAENCALTRQICAFLDPAFLSERYKIDLNEYISQFDFYFLNVARLQLSPSALFSEEAYRRDHPDVNEAIEANKLISGFSHYITTLSSEKRTYLTVSEYNTRLRLQELRERKALLEANIPGVTHPYALDILTYIDSLTGQVTLELCSATDPGMIVLVPNYLPEILFGGYIAFFDFLAALQTKIKLDLQLIIINNVSAEQHKQNIMRMKLNGGKRADIFSSIQLISSDRTLRIPEGYKVMSYCAETHYIASLIAKRLDVIPFFFIQEYEPDFHSNGDYATFSRNAFFLPHVGIYNSKILHDYFINDLEMHKVHGDAYRSCYFENHIRRISLDRQTFIERHQRKRGRRLIAYGRPEQHAARNLFATIILGLREALDKGYFDAGEWDFTSVGSLVHEGSYPISGKHKLRILTKMSEADYVDFLETGDIGVSFISTPHPGIVHFEMASCGLATLTNTTKRRSPAWLRSVNANLIGVELSPSAIAEGLKMAVEESVDLDSRFENARMANHLTRAECLQPAVDAVAAEFVQPARNDNELVEGS
jgi:hypothetical protein